MHQGQSRIRYLDGLRGIAILLVVIFHLWGSGAGEVLSFGGRFVPYPFVRLGWAGVELFFLISGYVILLTLERCTAFADFMVRRWLRLFPAMLVATCLLLVVNRTVTVPATLPPAHPFDFLPGLTFVGPAFYHAALHIPIGSLDPAFWTLYTEVAFYLIFALLYFTLGWRRAVVGLLLIDAATLSFGPLLDLVHAPVWVRRAPEPLYWLGCDFFAWFAAGVCFAKARETKDARLFWAAVAMGIAAIFTTHAQPRPMLVEDRAAMAAALAVFAAAQSSLAIQRILSWRPLLILGAISYPLYLIHQRIGLLIAWWWMRMLPGTPAPLVPLVGAVAVGIAAWAIATRIEPVLKRRLLALACRLPPFARLRSA